MSGIIFLSDTITIDSTGNGVADLSVTSAYMKFESGVDAVMTFGNVADDRLYITGRQRVILPNISGAIDDGINEPAIHGRTQAYRGNRSATVGLDNINCGVFGENNRGVGGGLKVGVYGLCNDACSSVGVLGEGNPRIADDKSSSWSGMFRYRPFIVGDPYANAMPTIYTEGRIQEWVSGGHDPGDEYATLIVFPYQARSTHSSNDALRGRVGIRTWIPAYELDVTGPIRATSNVIAYSDIRKKENIITINDGLSIVEQLRGVRFDWKEGFQSETATDKGKRQIGLIAQELEEILPELVSTDAHGFKSISYPNISAVLVEAIKDLKGIVDKQQEEINKLKEIIRE